MNSGETMNDVEKKHRGKSVTLKELSIEIILSIRNDQGSELQVIAEKIKTLSDSETSPIRRELLGFIETFLERRTFTPEEMHERIDRHCKVFARHRFQEIRARAKMLLGSHYKHTYKHFPEALKAFTEVETIVQKYLGMENMTQCETLFEKGGVYYFLGDYEKSTHSILQAQSLNVFSKATPELRFKSHINVSRNFFFLKNPIESRKHLELAEISWEDYQGVYDKAALLTRKADLKTVENDWKGALSILQEGLNYYTGTTFTLRTAEFLKVLGEFYYNEANPLRDFKLSMEYFNRCLELAKELRISRLEGALYHSMWRACKSFEEWKLCAEYMVLNAKIEEDLHHEEIHVYIKKLEHIALMEKQKMLQEGKPTYNETIIDEVMNLRKANETLQRKNSELHIMLSDIEILLEKKSQMGNGATQFLHQLQRIIQKGKSNQPAIEAYLSECNTLYPEFEQSLRKLVPSVTAMELKIAILIKLGISSQSIATICGVTLKSIENHRMRLRKKLNLRPEQSLSTSIISII